MHGAAGAVARAIPRGQAFGDDALAGEGGVAMDEQRHHHRAVVARGAVLVLLGARLAENHRHHDFQMRRVSGQRQVHLIAVELAVGGGAEVIFHVAGTFDLVGSRSHP